MDLRARAACSVVSANRGQPQIRARKWNKPGVGLVFLPHPLLPPLSFAFVSSCPFESRPGFVDVPIISFRSRGRHGELTLVQLKFEILATVPILSNAVVPAFRFSSSFHSIHHVPLHSQTGRPPCSFFRSLLPANFSLQSPSPSRLALLSTRFASTSSKQPTLKERLAALIPQEIENVCPDIPSLLPPTLF